MDHELPEGERDRIKAIVSVTAMSATSTISHARRRHLEIRCSCISSWIRPSAYAGHE